MSAHTGLRCQMNVYSQSNEFYTSLAELRSRLRLVRSGLGAGQLDLDEEEDDDKLLLFLSITYTKMLVELRQITFFCDKQQIKVYSSSMTNKYSLAMN